MGVLPYAAPGAACAKGCRAVGDVALRGSGGGLRQALPPLRRYAKFPRRYIAKSIR